MTKKAEPLTLDDKIRYQTTNRIDLDTGYLGATPDDPGGCETLGFIHMANAVLVGRPFYNELVAIAKRQESLEKAAAAIAEHYANAERERGSPYNETFKSPFTNKNEDNAVTINVRLLNALRAALKEE